MATQPRGGDRDIRRHGELRQLRVLVGLAALVFSIIYVLSDLIELAQGGFPLPVQHVRAAAFVGMGLAILRLPDGHRAAGPA